MMALGFLSLESKYGIAMCDHEGNIHEGKKVSAMMVQEVMPTLTNCDSSANLTMFRFTDLELTSISPFDWI